MTPTVPYNRCCQWRKAFLVALTCAFLELQGYATSDPPHYTRRATWHETMLASCREIERAKLPEPFPEFETETVTGGQAPRNISISLNGAKEIYLLVTGCPDVKWGVADWGEARLVDTEGKATSLRAIKGVKALLGNLEWDLTLRSGLYQKMRLGGQVYEHGAQVLANSILFVPVEGAFEKFEATIGIDDWAGTNGTVRFSVLGSRSAARQLMWESLKRDFSEDKPRQKMRWEREDRIWEGEWWGDGVTVLANNYARASYRVPFLQAQAKTRVERTSRALDLGAVRKLYYQSREWDSAVREVQQYDFRPLRMAVEDLAQRFPERYPQEFKTGLRKVEESHRTVLAKIEQVKLQSDAYPYPLVVEYFRQLREFEKRALLANPLLDFDKLLVTKRKSVGEPRLSQWADKGLGEFIGMPRQSSWANGTMPNINNWENEIAVVSPVRADGKVSTLFKPKARELVCDIDLNFEGDRIAFSMPDQRNRWQIHEIRADGSGLRQLTPSDPPEPHNYDPCYLPNGKILFSSTAVLQGVPCNAGVIVGNFYRMDADGRNIRQLCFDQDHDYTPSILNDGRILYLRWDYTDTPHVWNRILMSMNPDGTGQMEYYGDNAYWPNAVFYARAVPGHPTKIAGIVTGHHEGRVGELVIFDPNKGLRETEGVVQRIPGYGKKVEPLIEDKLTEHSWPKFLHPWPLDEKYFVVACKPNPDSLWGIYLVDVFDNMTLLKEEEGFVLLEPIPLRKRPAPPVIQEKVQPQNAQGLVYLENVYKGAAMKGVPPGTIKNLRVFTYHFGYQTLAGIDHRVGADGPWEVKRVLGTVPVEADGSAFFRVPAKQPISVQPLDSEGKAVALMRSWMTAMPGENLSCVGCHERPNATPPVGRRLALAREPSEIQPWHGPVRGFSFAREVQPVLDRYCVGCHNGETRTDGESIPDLRRDQGHYVVYGAGKIDSQIIRGIPKQELLGKYSGVFEPSYVALRQYIRVGGLESDLEILPPKEFHADTSELIRMLKKGHHDVSLDAGAWDRLITWIDLNAPCHGTWAEVTRLPGNQRQRRVELRSRYGGLVEDWEVIPEMPSTSLPPILPPAPEAKPSSPALAGWPLPLERAQKLQASEQPTTRTIELGNGIGLALVKIPAGSFVIGDTEGDTDEFPASVVQVRQPFWMGKFEISNEQFAQFASIHNSGFEDRSSWIFSEEYLGWRLNHPRQPVVRVSWQEAMAFCQWLSAKLGEKVTLPTEAQWEYACRAGSATPFSYGNLDTDFSRFANLGDVNLRKLADEGWRPKSPDLVPRDNRFNDGALVTTELGKYQPNAWGLHDMHGNAAEWTRTTYQPYPYRADDGREALGGDLKVIRGGSWRDRPKLARSASRWRYSSWQKVYNVGFRIVIEQSGQLTTAVPASPK